MGYGVLQVQVLVPLSTAQRSTLFSCVRSTKYFVRCMHEALSSRSEFEVGLRLSRGPGRGESGRRREDKTKAGEIGGQHI